MIHKAKTSRRLLICLLAAALLAALPGCSQAVGSSVPESSASSAASGAESGTDNSDAAAVLPVKEYTKKDLNADWTEADCTVITLSGDSASSNGKGATIDGSTVTITKAGDYLLSGTLNGRIIVSAEKTDDVRLILNGISITSPDSAAIWVQQADKVILTLAEGSENTLTDAETRDETLEDIPNAAVYSRDDLSINGTGALNVSGLYDHGVFTKNDLTITGGNIAVTAAGDGLKGKDSVAVQNGTVTIEAGGDGIQSSETGDSSKGWVRIEGGKLAITAAGDGIQAETVLYLVDGSVSVTAGTGSNGDGTKADTKTDDFGGHGGPGQGGRGDMGGKGDRQSFDGGSAPAMPEGGTFPEGDTGTRPERPSGDGSIPTPPDLPDQTASAPAIAISNDPGATTDPAADPVSSKGLKAGALLQIDGGTVDADSFDDAVHSNGDAAVTGGVLTLATGDDGIHADGSLTITGGEITVSKSYEGLEGQTVEISGGDIAVTAADDGINAAGGSDATQPGGRPSEDRFSGGSASLTISGGVVTVDASGDGIDSNGNLTFTGGTVLVAGPTSSGNGALDYDGNCTVSGGTLLASGSSGMAEAPRDARQPALKITFSAALEAGTPVALADENGQVFCVYVSGKSYNSLVISLPELEAGKSYRVLTGGSVSGVPAAGTDSASLYDGSGYQDGTQVLTFTLEEGVNNLAVD